MTKLLLLQKLKNDDLKEVRDNFPDLELLTADQMTDDLVDQIEILYGQFSKGQGLDPWFEKLVHGGKSLKWIQMISAGIDFLPLAELAKRGVIVSNMSGLHSEAISENVLAYMLIFNRSLKKALENQAKQVWDLGLTGIKQLQNKKIVIFGTGAIGSAVAKILQGFDVTVIGVNRHGTELPYFQQVITHSQLDQVADADYLISDMPLTDMTRGYFDSSFFHLFKNKPIFINVGRGPSVVEKDLISALKDETLSAAALDVVEHEPLDADSPLWQMENVIITPHSSALIEHYYKKSYQIFGPNLKSYLTTGKLAINQVSLKEGY
ncbi:phosphoglycerate dehydrogenase [Oenococcus sicerae]|uniref:phosphoglycerate dehydrogenase n=1 Tax=Oenococcus sicerae TaxID=2203724 RepID=UPI0010B67CB0|nr:D-2-hydroxyacid dehydrogenase [Oenococcus sicerae]